MEVYRRSSGLLLLLGLSLLATTLQGVQGEVESEGPSESECRPYIEKALKELEAGEAVVGSSAELGDSKEDIPTVEITDDSDHQEGDGEKDDANEDVQESKENEIVSEKKPEPEKTPSKKEEAANEIKRSEDKQDDASPERGDQPSVDDAESKEAGTEGDSKEEDSKDGDSKEEDSKDGDSKEEDLKDGDSKESDLKTDDTPSAEELERDDQSKESEGERIEAVVKEDSKEDETNSGEQSKEKTDDEKEDGDDGSKENESEQKEESQEQADEPKDDDDDKNNTQEESVEEIIEKVEAQKLNMNQDQQDESKKVEDQEYDQDNNESVEKQPQSDKENVQSGEDTKDSSKEDNPDDSKEDDQDGTPEEIKDDTKEDTKEDIKDDSKEDDNKIDSNEATEDGIGASKEDTVESKEVEGDNKSEEKDETRESREDAKDDKDSVEDTKKSAEQSDDDKKDENSKEQVTLSKEDDKDDDKDDTKEEKDDKSTEETDSKETQDDNGDDKDDENEGDRSSEDSGNVEELSLDIEIPTDLRSRDHVEQLLKLDMESSESEALINRVSEITLKDLKKLYENAIKPLEVVYKYRDLSNRHFADSEIFSKPLILFMGPWSGGKSSIINYLTNNEYNDTSLRTGAEPSPAYFNILMYGEEPEIIDGTELAADFTFSGLQKFGQGLEERLRGIKLPSKLLEKVNIVEIPGILEVRKQVSRVFPFNDACQWFIDRGDIIFLVYDPSKLDVGPETEAILDQLKGREHQTRIILNKADQVKPEELMRVQGALIWNISPLMSSPQPPIMYTTSLWSRPYESWAPVRLLQAQERSFLRDLRGAVDKRIENKIASARRFAVRVRNHAKMVDCYLTTYYNHKSVFGNRKQVADAITEHPQDYHIYEGLSTLTNISRYDLPDPDVYRDFFKLNPLYEFQQLSATCTYFRGCPINRLDIAIAYDLPELLGTHKKRVETALAEGAVGPQQTSAPGS